MHVKLCSYIKALNVRSILNNLKSSIYKNLIKIKRTNEKMFEIKTDI